MNINNYSKVFTAIVIAQQPLYLRSVPDRAVSVNASPTLYDSVALMVLFLQPLDYALMPQHPALTRRSGNFTTRSFNRAAKPEAAPLALA